MGIDTSCYTTSLALADAGGNLLLDDRIVLDVKKGDRGLRQSEGVFQHINNLSDMFDRATKSINNGDLASVCVSSCPRPVEGSYMPVFVAGCSIGRAVASAMGIPLLFISHQESHLMSGIWSAGGPQQNSFLAMHLSGGTTELLKVDRAGNRFNIQIIGGSTDISAGQFIDRVGVALGLSFPCGAELEKLAIQAGSVPPGLRLAIWTEGHKISFSGPETRAQQLINAKVDKQLVARAVLDCIARGIADIIQSAAQSTGIKQVLMVGGVSANSIIKRYLSDNLDIKFFFPRAVYCTDSAVGNAMVAVLNDR